MTTPDFKPLSLEDFKLSDAELKTIVNGAQKNFPPVDDTGNFIPVTPEKETDHAS